MIISRKYMKWKVLFSVIFLTTSGILFIGNSDSNTTTRPEQRSEDTFLSHIKNKLLNVDEKVQDFEVLKHDIKPSSQLFILTKSYLEKFHNSSSHVTLYNPNPEVPSVLNNTKNGVLNVPLSGVKSRELGPKPVLKPQIQKQENDTHEEPAESSIDYKDCGTAKPKPIKTYPEFSAIVSAHGSGNTWVRYLIERATGVSTGSYYHDPKLFHGGFLGEMSNPLHKNTILIKTHHPFQRKDIVFQNAVVIVRDPFEVVIAERNRVVSQNGHTSVVSESHFTGPEWEKFARGHSRYWEHSCRECITIPNYLIVYYEKLKENLEFELRRILKFLKVEPDETRLACTLAYPEGKFKRKKKQRKYDPFSKELIEEINGHIRNVSALFREHDITPLPFQERDLTLPSHDQLDKGVS